MKLSKVSISVNVESSHPARGAWIEISSVVAVIDAAEVAPREGCVD